jgi:hypothetical protein
MKRRRGGAARSLTSYSDQQDMAGTNILAISPLATNVPLAATYPDSAPRNYRRSSLQSTHSRLQPSVPLGLNTRSSSRAGSASPSQAMSMTVVQTHGSANNTVTIGGADIDSDRPAKRSRRSEPTSPVSGSSSASSEVTVQDSPQKLNDPRGNAEHQEDLRIRQEIEINESLENERTDAAVESHEREPEADRLGELRAAIAPKRRGRRPKRFRAETPVESTFGTPVPGTPSNGNDGGTGANTDQEQNKVIRRLPGRRRAPNPNMSIEADLRRQLTLKTSYRSVAKALKPILDEIAKRSVIQLEDDAEAHTRCPEYEQVSTELERRLQKRLAEVEAVFHYESERAKNAHDQAKGYGDMQFHVRGAANETNQTLLTHVNRHLWRRSRMIIRLEHWLR